MTVQYSKHVAYILPCVIKTVVLTYTINIVIRIQAHCDASIQTEALHQSGCLDTQTCFFCV